MSDEPPLPSRDPADPRRSGRLDDALRSGTRQLDADASRPRDPGLGPPWLRGLLAVVGALIVLQVAAVVAFVTAPLIGLPIDPEFPIGIQAVATLPAIALLLWCWQLMDRLPLPAIGLRGSTRRAGAQLLTGAGIGAAAMAALVLAGALAGGYSISGGNAPPMILRALAWTVPLAVVAFFEELAFRGYLLQDLGRRNVALGLGLSSVAFALVHSANPNAWGGGLVTSTLMVLNLVLAGAWLATLFLRSGALWLPTGAHLAWNATQGLVFGLPVSGLDTPSLLDGAVGSAGSIAWGGAFGPESGGVATLLLSLLTLEGAIATWRRPLPVEQIAASMAREPVACSPSLS